MQKLITDRSRSRWSPSGHSGDHRIEQTAAALMRITSVGWRRPMVSDLKKGDVVKLRSGGPNMTVQGLDDYTMSCGIEDGVNCVWFEGNKQHSEVFDRAVLVKVDQQ